jgi:hypothetical protein
MTGAELAALMLHPPVRRVVVRAARRHSKSIEDQEEYIQDAWMRIAEHPDGMEASYYGLVAYRAINAAYKRRARMVVDTAPPPNVHGISSRTIHKRIPRDAVPLGRGRFLVRRPEKLSSWYYDGEWKEYGLEKGDVTVRTFYEIIVVPEE